MSGCLLRGALSNTKHPAHETHLFLGKTAILPGVLGINGVWWLNVSMQSSCLQLKAQRLAMDISGYDRS